jgi:hypothetical protein
MFSQLDMFRSFAPIIRSTRLRLVAYGILHCKEMMYCEVIIRKYDFVACKRVVMSRRVYVGDRWCVIYLRGGGVCFVVMGVRCGFFCCCGGDCMCNVFFWFVWLEGSFLCITEYRTLLI